MSLSPRRTPTPPDDAQHQAEEELVAPMPGFQTPEPELLQPNPSSDAGSDSAAGKDLGNRKSGSTASTKAALGDGALFGKKAEVFGRVATVLLQAVGGLLHRRLAAPDSEDWIPDDEDEAAIPPPVGRIAARRVPLPGDTTDIVDALEAIVALTGYVGKNVKKHLAARRAAARARTVQPAPPPMDIPAEQNPEPAAYHAVPVSALGVTE